jgi:hypothetical protein
MRLPLRPRPLPHEALSSWVGRLAAAYALPCPVFLRLAFAGEPLPKGADLDSSERPDLSEMFADWTGLSRTQVRAMTFAGYMPELIDTTEPSPDLFAGYACRFGWFLPPAPRVRAGLSKNWMPWLTDDLLKPPPRCCTLCLKTDTIPYVRLHWRLGWMASCPLHEEMLVPSIVTASGMSAIQAQEPKRAALSLLALDQITLGAITTGVAVLPRGSGVVPGGAWLRALRALLDELVQPMDQVSPVARGEITAAWLSAGKGCDVRYGRMCVPLERLLPAQRALLLQVAGAVVRFLAARPARKGAGTALRACVSQWAQPNLRAT